MALSYFYDKQPQTAEGYKRISMYLKTELIKYKSIVVFGSQGMGVVIKNILLSFGLNTSCFCDNSALVSDENNQVPVYKPSDAAIKYPNALYILSGVEPSTCNSMKKQLKDIAPHAHYCFYDVIYYYYVSINRNIDLNIFGLTLLNFFNDNSETNNAIHSLSFRITNKCTLKCKECAFLVPYQKEHYDFPIDDLISSLKTLCALSDGVLDLTINGGETFLYNDLFALLKEIVCIPRIINIVIVTNGTIVPSDDILKFCANNAIRIRISNYGQYSTKINELYNKCLSFNVSISEFYRAQKWYSLGTMKHNRSDNENRSIADNCPFNGGKNKRILGLYKGGVHICDRYDGLLSCGCINKDSYSGLHYELSTGNRDSFSKFLLGESLYKLCDMCNWPMETVTPAQQIEEIV